MTRHVISVGGTGQHIALALTRLVYLGALKPDIKLIAIDPDNQTALPKVLEAPAGMRKPRHPLQADAVFAPFDIAKVGTAPFNKMFSDPDHPLETELFEALFDVDSASIPISKGMYGTPCVGATVFADGSGGAGLQNLLKPLAGSDAVFICGSVVGGTGAGVMHKLIAEIRKHYTKELYGIFMLPWFSVSTGATKGAISDTTIQRNAQHGIKYFYEHTIPELTASLLIGYPGTVQQGLLKPVTVQDGEMGEMPHYLHAVAASAIVTLPNAHTAHRGVKAYGVVHDPADEGWLLDANWDPGTPSLRMNVRAHKFLLHLCEFITRADNRQQILDYYKKGTIARTLSDCDAWGDLHQSVVDNQKSVAQQGEFAQTLMAELEQITNEVRFCVHWVSKLFPGDVSNVPQDRLLDDLDSGASLWLTIAKIWKGKAFKPDVARALQPMEVARHVARHHAKVILTEGLRVPA